MRPDAAAGPVFAVLIGIGTRDRRTASGGALSPLSGHFVDVVRGCPPWSRTAGQRTVGHDPRVTDRYRRATLETLRLGFASSAALELVATLSVALVAVCVGLRLASGPSTSGPR